MSHDANAMADANIHEKWVSMYRTPEAQAFYEMAFDELARRLQAPADARILDAGCGSCAKSVLLARRGFRVMGMDFSNEALAMAPNTIRHYGVEGRIDPTKYEGMEPLYTEYSVGPFARSFSLSHLIDQQRIDASFTEGVLTLNLRKVQKAEPRRIEIS